jgi:mTERF domain-containing protein
MIPAAEVEKLSLLKQGNAAAADDDAQVVAVLDKEEVALREALKIRRKNTAEALCAALQAAKMSPRYSREVVAKMPAFVDQIMLEAVALKGDSKFVTSSFASRARACIDRTKVVESIK